MTSKKLLDLLKEKGYKIVNYYKIEQLTYMGDENNVVIVRLYYNEDGKLELVGIETQMHGKEKQSHLFNVEEVDEAVKMLEKFLS